MTFPSSPFPRTPVDELPIVIPSDSPFLRSSPLWRQTWVECDHKSPAFQDDAYRARFGFNQRGYWFPPPSCRVWDARRRFILSSRWDWNRNRAVLVERLYSVDNCPSCTSALQAVELMVYSVARFLADEPEQWEHRCYFRIGRPCSCGERWTWSDCSGWDLDAQWSVISWAVENERLNMGDAEFFGYNQFMLGEEPLHYE
jgi:hypothetical protein